MILLFGFTFIQAKTYEYFHLVKDPSIMSMGGANIALGGSANSIFTNSAGLTKIPKEYGSEFKLLSMGTQIGENSVDFFSDIQDANTDDNSEIIEILEKYQGKNMYAGVDLETFSYAQNFDSFALGITPFGGLSVNMKSHSGFGSSGLLETNGIIYGGVAVALAKDLNDLSIGKYNLNKLSVGGGIKVMKTYVWSHNMLVSEIADHKDDMFEYLKDDIATNDTAAVLDLGAIYNLKDGFDVGVSLQNIGGIGDESKVEIPMTFGVGLGYTLRLEDRAFFNQFRFGADYIDMFGGYEDDSLIKRTRFGVNANVVDSSWAGLSVGLGLYQGNLSLGADLRLAFVKLSYAMYEEELSSKAGSESEKRQSVRFSIEF